jgi:N-acyl homoserine lactone hydrolase
VTTWRAEVLVPAHRIVVALTGDDVLEISGSGGPATFRGYRRFPDAVHGMIAWPNTVLLTGEEPVVVDPGYQTQGDMLVQALERRGLAPGDVRTVVMTHLHSDHVTALPQLGPVTVHVHAEELEAPHGRRNRGMLDQADVVVLAGDAGEVRPGIRWIHTPGHAPGHIAVLVDTADGLVVVAGDTMGPEPHWYARRDPPAGLPERQAHLDAYARIDALDPAVIIPGHYPPIHRG